MKVLFAASALLLLISCSPKNSLETTQNQSVGVSDSSSVEDIVDEIVSCFENSTPVVQYDYIEALGDGRGYTAGKAGFTTATGDLLEVVQTYLQTTSDPDFASLLPILRDRARSESGSLEGLQALPALWVDRAKTTAFRHAQDLETNLLYWRPAAGYLRQFHFTSNLAMLIFYDTIIQHGDGDDPDSFSGVIAKMSSRPTDETEFLMSFLEARRKVLMNPSDSSTTQAWRESVDRVNALEQLIVQNRWTLTPPFKVTVYGDTFSF